MASNQGGATRPNGPHAHWFKLVLLGEMAVGKSSLAIRLVSGVFHKSQDSTIGAARLSHTVWLGDAAVRLEIWDTAGQERFHSLANLFYRGAQAAVVVYDITSEPSFERAKSWVEELRTKSSPDMVIALAGSKADLADKRAVDARDARSYADDNGLLFMETSAKTSANVDEIFAAVAERLLPPEGSEEPPQAAGSGQSRGVDLEATPPAKVKAPCCRT